jgi:hypothetical protein
MKNKVAILWHEKVNYLAIADLSRGGLPLMTILDDEYEGINPFYSLPISDLITLCDWIPIGEL